MAVTIDELDVQVEEAPPAAPPAEAPPEAPQNLDLAQALELHHERISRLRAD